MNYRAQQYPTLDTFYAFFYDYSFILCKWIEKRLTLIETIPVERSTTFMHLALTYCNNWTEKYDVTLQEIRKKQKNRTNQG